jgi:hypothetical protein
VNCVHMFVELWMKPRLINVTPWVLKLRNKG